MKPKLMVSDIDGTLIGSDRLLPPELAELAALLREQQENLIFTIASGRIHSRIQEVVRALGITAPVIGCNGASAAAGEQVLWNILIPPHCLREAVELADSLGMSVILTDGITETAWRKTPWVQNLMENYRRYDGVGQLTVQEWETAAIQKVLIDDSARSGRLGEVLELLNRYSDQLTLVQYGNSTLDISPAGCTKGQAMLRLAEHLGVDRRDILAIGDDTNDLEMIQAAGVGIAVRNANPLLREAADYVCQGERHLGVIEAVKRFVVQREEPHE